MRSSYDLNLYYDFSNLSAQQQRIVKEFNKQTVDQTLHYFLWIIEQSDAIDLVYRDPNNFNNIMSFKEVSNRLCGDLHNWIKKYSKYRPSI